MTTKDQFAVADSITNLLIDSVKRFIRFPKQLKTYVTEKPDGSYIVELQPHKDDFGKVLGTRAVTFQALRYLFESAVSRATGKTMATLLLLEAEKGVTLPKPPFFVNPDYTSTIEHDLLLRWCAALIHGEVRITTNEQDSGKINFYLAADSDIDIALVRSLETIFHAIGKTHGKLIFINLAP